MAGEDFKRIFETLHVAVAVTDPAGLVTRANAAFANLAGGDVAVFSGTDIASFFAADDRERVRQNVLRVAGGKAASGFFEAALVAGDERHWVSVALQPALDARGKPEGVLAVLHDIDAQRETDEALNLVTARLLALGDVLPVGMLIETSPGDIELVNEAFCRLLCLDSAPQSLSGLNVYEALARSAAIDRGALEQARRAPREAASFMLKLEGGRTIALERDPIVVEGAHGGAVWTPREEAMPGGGAEKGAAQIAVIEKIGQELSIALEGIGAITARAQRMDDDSALLERLDRIRASTQGAMAAIGELVDFSRLSGGVVLRRAPFRLRAALAELLSRVVPLAEEKRCRLRVKVEQDVSDALEGDEERLQIVLRHLLEGAIACAPGEEITLHITPEYMTDAGIQLSFDVVASGGAPANRAADTGMGIALARFMVTAMGGVLNIALRTGADALYAFTIEFPTRAPAPAPRRATYVSLVAMPVLVVSAEPQQRHAVSNLLRGWRMAPIEADNAGMAIALLERFEQEGNAIPLVIVSNRLPVQDGFLLAFRIKHHPKLGATLVMMLASEGRPGDAIACRENGISAYMRYPIADRQLNEAIAAVTGASVDTDETPTLVTRHSLREHRKGATVLLVDPNRDSQILASHILGRQDCSVVVAQDLREAMSALEQDVYDLVLVDTALEGLRGDDAARMLRERMGKNANATRLAATSLDHSIAFTKSAKAIGFDATIAKPFRKDELLALLASGKAAGAPRS